MLDYIVLGQIPGTGLALGFLGYLALFDLGLIIYLFKKFHPEQFRKINERYGISKKRKLVASKLSARLKTAAKKLKPYAKRVEKQLIHFRDDVLGPKLKFLK